MGITSFIKNRFLGKEICLTMIDSEAETIQYNQSTNSNREYFRGVVEEVEDDVVVLNVKGHGNLYISEHFIRCFWEPNFEYYRALSTSITRKLAGSRR